MKIAFLVSRFPSLSETFILNQITGLLDRGHHIDIFSVHAADESELHEDVVKYQLIDRTTYLHIPKNKIMRLLKGIYLLLKNFYLNPLLLLKSLDVIKYGRFALSLKLLYAAVAFLKYESCDVLYCHFGPNGMLGVMLRDIGVVKGKVITSFHGVDLSKYIQDRGQHVYRYLFTNGDLFLPVCRFWQDILIQMGCPPHKTIVHRMGVDTMKFAKTASVPINDGRTRVLTIARLVEKKGVVYGIRAVGKARRRFPNLFYTIIGEGPLRQELENLVVTSDLSDTVRLMGWKKQETVIPFLHEADILLAPSIRSADGDQEGIPVVLIEALSIGLVVITTRQSGIPELIHDGITGFFVPEKDTDALADKLEFLIQHPEVRHKVALAGRALVKKEYNIQRLNDSLEKMCRSVLG